jgi:hypothetical protein
MLCPSPRIEKQAGTGDSGADIGHESGAGLVRYQDKPHRASM